MTPPWLRLKRAMLANPKFVRLSLSQRGVLITCLAATDADGCIPTLDDMSFYLGVGEIECRSMLDELLARKWLIGEVVNGDARYRFKGWETHQFKSDNSTDRTRKHRMSKKGITCAEAPQSADGATSRERSRDGLDTEQSRAEKKRLTGVSSTEEETSLRSRPEWARTGEVERQDGPRTASEAKPAQIWRSVMRGDQDFNSLLLSAAEPFRAMIRKRGELRVDQDGFVFTPEKVSKDVAS